MAKAKTTNNDIPKVIALIKRINWLRANASVIICCAITLVIHFNLKKRANSMNEKQKAWKIKGRKRKHKFWALSAFDPINWTLFMTNHNETIVILQWNMHNSCYCMQCIFPQNGTDTYFIWEFLIEKFAMKIWPKNCFREEKKTTLTHQLLIEIRVSFVMSVEFFFTILNFELCLVSIFVIFPHFQLCIFCYRGIWNHFEIR